MALAVSATSPLVSRKWRPFIAGAFADGNAERELFDPATGESLCKVGEVSAEQTQNAIVSAREAFDKGPWPRTTAKERADYLFKLARLLDNRAEDFAHVETLNAGKPLRESKFDVADSANCLRYYAGLVSTPQGQTVDVPAPSVTQIVREPIGVCGQIIPWNYPLQMAVWKIAPALSAGNTCILKTSELTPLTAYMLAELLQELDLPPGVVSIISGDGAIGQQLAESLLVDKIAFTGSGRTGRLVAQAALGNLKKVTLELGGKSPMIVFGDVDVELAVDHALYAIFCHAGQVCSAGSRFIVENSIYDKFVERFIERSKKINVGSGMDPETEMGPLVSKQHRQRVLDYVQIGRQEGAHLALGGDAPAGAKYGNGYYFNPTVFTDVRLDMRIVQEEVFGLVCTIEKFKTEDEAVTLANGTRYGLAGAVFTNDATRAYRVARAIRAGVTWINLYHNCYNECPFGGYKESGWGRECGTFGLDAYTEVKQINLNLDPRPVEWFRS